MSSSDQPDIIAVCRFSYLATRGWKRTVDGDVRATEAVLFDDTRLRDRFELFEAVCLPSVLGQDVPMRLMLVASPRLPDRWKQRLETLVAPHTGVSIQYLRPRPMTEAVGIAIRRMRGDATGHMVQVALDDDDALAQGYARRVRAVADGLIAAGLAEAEPVALSFPRGITLSRQNGVFAAQETVAPYLALGLGLLTNGATGQHVFSVPHLKTPERHRAWCNPGPVAWLRGLHDFHDSKGVVRGRETDLSQDALRGVLSEHFPFLDADRVLTLFGAPTASTASESSAG